MAFTRYTRAESSSLLSKKDHKEIEEELEKEGVPSMKNLSEASRKRVSKRLDNNA